ncbi:PB1 domain-containing protein [Abeliophyllum distichum]|uniref:PB1 domain-containing protein n=1 Tax=Abeliophyllum distichum TaxID=126358 RepID=A0ABD1TGZ1_9LAMI
MRVCLDWSGRRAAAAVGRDAGCGGRSWMMLNLGVGKDINMRATAKDCGFPESSSVNSHLRFDDYFVDNEINTRKYVESQMESSKNDGDGNGNTVNHDVHSVPDSPILEANSSFGSAFSSPSMANLRHIRVRVAAGTVVLGVPIVAGGGGENANRTFSDDDKSYHGRYIEEIYGSVENTSIDTVVDETDLSLRKLEELHRELQTLHKEKIFLFILSSIIHSKWTILF